MLLVVIAVVASGYGDQVVILIEDVAIDLSGLRGVGIVQAAPGDAVCSCSCLVAWFEQLARAGNVAAVCAIGIKIQKSR